MMLFLNLAIAAETCPQCGDKDAPGVQNVSMDGMHTTGEQKVKTHTLHDYIVKYCTEIKLIEYLETRKDLSRAFRLLYRSKLNYEQALSEIEQTLPNSPELQHLLNFCRESKRGILGLSGSDLEESLSLEESDETAAV